MNRMFKFWAGVLALSATAAFGDSLLNQDRSIPASPYMLGARPPKAYNFQIHDTVMLDISIKDTLEFTKKLDTKKDVSLAAKIKSWITDFRTTEKVLPNVELEGKNDFKTKGSKTDESKVSISIPAEVVEILPNGDLVLDAARTVMHGEDTASVRLGGRVSPRYVSRLGGMDRVSSDRILDLTVKTESKGPLSDNEKRGLITRLFTAFPLF